MAFDPVTATVDLVKEGLKRFFPEKMTEQEKASVENNMEMFILSEASKQDSSFREFVLGYEGAAKDIPKGLVWVRSAIRPAFTIAVGYWDWLYFSGAVWDVEKVALLKAINLIVLCFWFGERFVQRSGIMDVLKSKTQGG